MGQKADLTEVRDLAEKVKQETTHMTEVFNTLETSANAIIDMDSFQGLSANNVKNYLEELHVSLAKSFRVVFDDLNNSFTEHISTFQSMVDANDAAIVQSDYLHIDIAVHIDTQYNSIKGYVDSVGKTISSVSDIVSLSSPESYSITKAYNSLSDTVEELEENFQKFEGKGKSDINKVEEMLELIEVMIKKAVQVDPTERFSDFKSGSANNVLYESKGFAQYLYTMNGLLDDADNAITESAKYGYKGKSKQPNVKPHPYTKPPGEKAKYIGKESLKGSGASLKNASALGKGATKALGPLSIGLTGYANYHDAKAEGLDTKEAVVRTVSDTAVDTAVGGAVQAGATALGTALIPIPGVGTAVGALVGIGINSLLNVGWGDTKTSAMDVIKKPFRKIASWFS